MAFPSLLDGAFWLHFTMSRSATMLTIGAVTLAEAIVSMCRSYPGLTGWNTPAIAKQSRLQSSRMLSVRNVVPYSFR